MEKTLIKEGKDIQSAIDAALLELGLSRDDVSIMVLAKEEKGFLGFGKKNAKIQVTFEVPDPIPEVKKPEAPKSALGAASRSKKPAAPAPVKKPAEPKADVKPEPKAEAPKPVKAETPKAPKEQKSRQPKAPKPEAPKAEVPAEPKVYAPAESGSVEEKIEVFIKGLLEHMGSQAVPHAWKENENTYMVDLVGDDLGYLIGRRGDTLDAIQHLSNYSINRGVEGHIRINVDAEAYREKREESLRRYARKKAQQVLKAHRRTTLEPMNAYERHVIHATLQDMDRITTYSVGTEPNRRVVIEYVR